MLTSRSNPPTVQVFSFRTFERGVEMAGVAPFKATRETIESVYRGEVLAYTGECVPAEELDDAGRWLRRPTGWQRFG